MASCGACVISVGYGEEEARLLKLGASLVGLVILTFYKCSILLVKMIIKCMLIRVSSRNFFAWGGGSMQAHCIISYDVRNKISFE